MRVSLCFRRFHVFMEYYEAHKVKMFVLSELVEEIVSSGASFVEDQKDQIWVNETKTP